MENASAEQDVYDELLTQAEIQGNVNQVNGESRVGKEWAAVVSASEPASASLSLWGVKAPGRACRCDLGLSSSHSQQRAEGGRGRPPGRRRGEAV